MATVGSKAHRTSKTSKLEKFAGAAGAANAGVDIALGAEAYKEAVKDRQETKSERRRILVQAEKDLNVTKEIYQTLVQSSETIREIVAEVEDLKAAHDDLEASLMQMQLRLSAEIDNMIISVTRTMVFSNYKEKWDHIFFVEVAIERFIRYAEKISLRDLRYECITRDLKEFLTWVYKEINKPQTGPSLISAIRKIGNFARYRRWISIVAGDFFKAVGYLAICESVAKEKKSKDAIIKLLEPYWEKLQAIEKTMISLTYDVFADAVYLLGNPVQVKKVIE